MNSEKESERFGRIAKEDPGAIYEAIESSQEPWWGIGILSQKRMDEYRDEEKLRFLIDKFYDLMIETIRTSPEPWNVIWNMQYYRWFFERVETQDAIAEAIRVSGAPAQVLSGIRHIRIVLKNEKVRASTILAMSTTERPASLVCMLRDYPDILVEPQMIDVVSERIKTSEEFWWIVIEVSRLRFLAENPMIRGAIASRIGDLTYVFENHADTWQIIPSLAHIDTIMQEPDIIDAVATALRKSKAPFNLLGKIRWKTNLTSQSQIQDAVADLFQTVPADELWRAVSAIDESRLLIESETIQKVVKQRIVAIANTISEHENPRDVVEGLALMRYIMDDELVRQAISSSLSKIVNRTETSHRFWDFYRRTIWIPEISDSPETRRQIVDSVLMADVYGQYVSQFKGFPILIQDKVIIEGILKSIRTFEDPAWFISALGDIPVLLQNSAIRSEIERRIPRIIQQILEDKNEYLTQEISETDFMMEYDEIYQAVVERIKSTPTPWRTIAELPDVLFTLDLVRDIIREGLDELAVEIWNRQDDCPYILLIGILRSEDIISSPEIKEVFDQYLGSLIEDLDNRWEVWYDISEVCQIPFYLENDLIKKSIRMRSKDLAHALCVREDQFCLLDIIAEVLDFVDEAPILEAVISLLKRCYNPWRFLDNSGLEEFLKDDRIRGVLKDRIPDIVFGITSTTDASFIVSAIGKVDFLQNDERIIDAVAEYTERIT